MDHPKRPTLRDVAAKAGVSVMTASRVVNREQGVKVRATTMQRVVDAIAELGYQPDHRARLLRRGETSAGTIGVVVADLSNPFFSKVLWGIEQIAQERGNLVLVASTEGSPQREEQLLDELVGRRVDGLLVVPSGTMSDQSPLAGELARGTPLVFLDNEPASHGVDVVRSDHYAGGRHAARHFLARGHGDMAYFGDDPQLPSAALRLQGFGDESLEHGHSIASERVVTGSHSSQEWQAIAIRYLEQHAPPTAIFSAQNYASMGTLQALHALNLQHRVAQVGFDDLDLATLVNPGLTVLAQKPRDLGKRAANVLFDRIDGRSGDPVRQVIEPTLIERGSGEI